MMREFAQIMFTCFRIINLRKDLLEGSVSISKETSHFIGLLRF